MKHSPFLPDKLAILEHWMAERERIRIRRSFRKPAPYTDDPTLQRYRFCNVIRMDDRVSQWLFQKWYRKATPEQLIVAATIGRLINEPRTLSQIPFPHRYDEGQLCSILQNLRATNDGETAVFGNAYLVVGTEFADGGKAVVLPRIVQRVYDAKLFRFKKDEPRTMEEMHARLMSVRGLGSFLAGQIVADLRHLLPGQFSDPATWAPVGPGSARGMHRLLGQPARRQGMPQRTFMPLLAALRAVVRVPPSAAKRLEAMDLQNCLCEFDKYSRVAEGRRPRRLFP